MTIVSHAREADRIPENAATRRPFDLAPLEGDWTSATGLDGGIARVGLHGRDGQLIVSATGRGEPRPGDWGEVAADSVYSNAIDSGERHAFMATFDNGRVRSHLQTYQALGILTMHAFHHFHGDEGRRDYFTREFCVPEVTPPAVPVNVGLPKLADNDPGPLLGTWRGLAPEITKSIGTLELLMEDGGLKVRAEGVGADGPVDWGTTDAQAYADGHYLDNPPAFLATFDHGYMRVHLQGRPNRGVLVACEYTEFTDGSGRSNYFIRECFRR
jgi:hypothetical protein